jgi:hypothetical protein
MHEERPIRKGVRGISLSVSHRDLPDGPIQGFRFIWAFYVNGFRPEHHCQMCFKGRRHEQFYTGNACSGRVYDLNAMNRYPYVYVCGVGIGPDKDRWKQNFHMPLIHSPRRTVTRTTYNGYVVCATNALEVVIPQLPEGWNGLDRKTVRCKNFQFAVAQFGYPRSGLAS